MSSKKTHCQILSDDEDEAGAPHPKATVTTNKSGTTRRQFIRGRARTPKNYVEGLFVTCQRRYRTVVSRNRVANSAGMSICQVLLQY